MTDEQVGELDDMDGLYDDWWLDRDKHGSAAFKCRYCKRDGFYWCKTKLGWRLVAPTGKVHDCGAYNLRGSKEIRHAG